jgi:stage V sporulation protein B
MNHVEIKRRQLQRVGDILGLLVLLLLGRMIGDEGICIFAVAWEILSFLLNSLSDSVPDAMARLLRSKNARGKLGNARRIRRSIFRLQFLVGLAGGILLFVLSEILAKGLFSVPYAVLGLKILAPVLFLRCLMGAFLGEFQGQGTEMPTVVVSLLRPVFVLGLGLLFGNIFKDYGQKVSALLQNQHFTAMYGVAGFCLGILISEVLLFLFLLLLLLGTKRSRSPLSEIERGNDSFGYTVARLYRTSYKDMGEHILQKLFLILGMLMAPTLLNESWVFGIYYGKYLLICGWAILIGTIILMPIGMRIQVAIHKEEYAGAGKYFGTAIHLVAVFAFFAISFVSFGAVQIQDGLFLGDRQMGEMLRGGSALIVLWLLCSICCKVLRGMNRRGLVFVGLGLGCVGYAGGCMLFVWALGMKGMGLVLAGLMGGLLCCVFLAFWAIRLLPIDVDWIRLLLYPAVFSIVVGLMTLFLGRLLSSLVGALPACFICLLASLLLYWLGLLYFRVFREEEWMQFPGGRLMAAISRMLKL